MSPTYECRYCSSSCKFENVFKIETGGGSGYYVCKECVRHLNPKEITIVQSRAISKINDYVCYTCELGFPHNKVHEIKHRDGSGWSYLCTNCIGEIDPRDIEIRSKK